MIQSEKKDSLFRLIHSMDRGEKRFFSIYCARQENAKGKSYVQLFNVIEKQEQYDEAQIKKTFRGSQIHFTKNYLYNLILEVLAHYNRDKNELNSKLAEVQVLFEKKLYDLAQNLVLKVRVLAEEKNDFSAMLETFKLERRILSITRTPFDKKYIRVIRDQEQNCINRHLEIENYFETKMEVEDWMHLYQTMNRREEKKKFSKLAEQSIFKNIDQPQSVMAKYILYHTRAIYYNTSGDYALAYDEHHRLMRLLDDNPVFKKNYPLITEVNLVNLISYSNTLGKYETAIQLMKKLKALYTKPISPKTKERIIIAEIIMIGVYESIGMKQEGMQLISEISKKNDNKEITNPFYLSYFYFNAASFCLLYDDPRRAMSWLNKILNSTLFEKDKSAIYYNSKILELIVLVELKEYDLLVYKLKSFHRFSMRQASRNRFDTLISDFVSKIIRGTGNYDKKNILLHLAELHTALVKLFKDELPDPSLQYFDLIGWLESKIQRKPYAEIAAMKKGN